MLKTAGTAGEVFPEGCLCSALGKLSTEDVFNLDPSVCALPFPSFPPEKTTVQIKALDGHFKLLETRHLPAGHLEKQSKAASV